MRQKGLLIVISGPSGCGKGTICKELRARHPEIKVSVSTTTREIRAGEVEGRDYRYISKEEFERQVQEGSFWNMRAYTAEITTALPKVC